MKTRNKGHSAPGYQIFDFKPFIFSLKDNKFWSAWRLEPMTAHLITVFYHWANAWAIFKIYGEIVFLNTNYAFDGWIIRAPAFFLFFLQK